jgi:type III secretion system YscD/HrpQ family protein
MGAEFIAEEGVLKGLILALEKGEEWTIGRDPDQSSIVIEDPKASRLHARVNKTDEGYFVENLSDTNPISVNGETLKEIRLLNEGDTVTIGDSTFRFYPEGAPATYGFQPEFFEEEETFTEEQPSEESPPEEKAEETVSPEEEEEEVFEARDLSEESPEEELTEDTFDASELPEMEIDLRQTTRFILKVIAGPNTGAEFALDYDRQYLIGTDTVTCDIIFNDLSVSREHAQLGVSKDGIITIRDLGSRNGVIVERERIITTKEVAPNSVVALGTSAFMLIDREAPSETIAAPLYEPAGEEFEEKEERAPAIVEEEPVAAKVSRRKPAHPGTLVLSLIIGGLALLLGIAMVSLFQTEEVEFVHKKDYISDLNAVMSRYSAVCFTYNEATGRIFLVGHVKTGIEHNELMYQLKGLGFLTGIDDHVVNDEAVWQEMNILLSKHTDFKGVSMHSPEAGVFVIGGYLQTDKQAADLIDYLNVNFNYLSLLQNRVIVEQSVVEDIVSRLIQDGFGAVTPSLSNGDLQLTGYINANEVYSFDALIEDFKKIPGVRNIRNYVVSVTPEQKVIDLNKRFPLILDVERQYQEKPMRYRVTGYSKHGDISINVVINGKILTRGDCLDGYTITSIQPHAVFLEKDGLKYKIEYNKCNSFGI